MERTSFVLRIDPARHAEYVERHRNVYPELLKAFGEAGIATYSIFYCDGYLFNYMETENYEQTMAKLAEYPVYWRWQEFMADMLLPDEAGRVSRGIPEVFYYGRSN